MIGNRINLARQLKGYSQRRLAPEVGVTAQAISKYERGEDIPSSGVLLQLARALGVRVEFFLRPSTVALARIEFRKRSTLGEKEKNSIIAQTREWVERYLDIERILGLDERSRFKLPPESKRRASSLDDVERVAIELRRSWRLGFDPIESMTELLEDKGVKVRLVEGHAAFDALTLWADGRPVIAVKRPTPGDRQRLSLAHELGHLVVEVAQKLREKAAFRFAGAFLVPEEVARKELLSPQRHRLDLAELYLLKHKYGLSMQAWVYRAKDLAILTEGRAREMFRLFKSRGWYEREPGEQLPPEKPSSRMQLLVMQALAENLISESRAAELLGKSLVELRREVGIAA